MKLSDFTGKSRRPGLAFNPGDLKPGGVTHQEKTPAPEASSLADHGSLLLKEELIDEASGRAKTSNPDVQSIPLLLGVAGTTPRQMFKVDLACRIGSQILVMGWSTTSIELGLMEGDLALVPLKIQMPRPDVAKHLKSADDSAGFVLIADSSGLEAVSMTWQPQGERQLSSQALKLITESEIAAGDLLLGKALSLAAVATPPYTPRWRHLIANVPLNWAQCPHARGFLEAASTCAQTGECIVVGWAVQQPGALVWLEDDTGNTYPLEGAYRRFRQDVHDSVSVQFDHANRDAGLIARIPALKVGATVKLKTISADGIHVLGEAQCKALPTDPVAAANWLFSIGTPVAELHARVPAIDEPTLGALIKLKVSKWSELPVKVTQLGTPLASPKVSVIVPLYGRTDFVEHQLIEFCADPWFMQHAELIYVLDDPKLLEPFIGQAEALHRLYKVPFCWLWGNANRGFSGANNLGVQSANGQYLMFLNSDAFPQQPGWLEALVDVLETRPDIGAVGPRLVFADGSIQHAGMEFMRRNELGIWVNHHPNMGLDPSLDPTKELTLVPAVTGACLAMRRTDFDHIDGWDTGYLIGDFEDSDLCLKLRAEGFNIGYLPTVQLTHLERQSFKLLGQSEFRSRVVIYNAVRHQNRWAAVIDQPVNVNAPAPIAASMSANEP